MPDADRPAPLSPEEIATLRETYRRLLANSGYLTGCEQMGARLLATLDVERAAPAPALDAQCIALADRLGEAFVSGKAGGGAASVASILRHFAEHAAQEES